MPNITDWLRKESLPNNLYELLGHPLLDANREDLLRSLRAANRELLDYQSHPEPAVSNRAIALLTELGRARGILEDPAKLQPHTEELTAALRREFTNARGAAALTAGTELSVWLVLRYGVDHVNAERIAQLVRGVPESPLPALLPEPDRSRFGAFAAPPPSSANPPKQAAPEPVAVYSLDETGVPAALPKPAPSRKSERGPRVGRSRARLAERREPGSVKLWPLIIAAAVLALAGVIELVYIATRESPKKVENPPDQRKEGPAPARPEGDPNAVQSVPMEEPVPTGTPKSPKPETPLPPPPTTDPSPKPVPKGATEEPKLSKNPFRGDPVEEGPVTPPKPPVTPPVTPPKPPITPPKPDPVIPTVDEVGWVKVDDGSGTWKVTDAEARIHSVELKQVTIKGDKYDALVIWVDLRNTGKTERTSRRWMNWSKTESDFYDECKLMNLQTFMPVKKPYWLTQGTKPAEFPTWKEDQRLAAGEKLTVPLLFNPPLPPVREFNLTLDAIRLTEFEVGRSKEAGTFRLSITDKDWKKGKN